MKLAFYYHIPILRRGSDLMLPGYLGVFIDSLAKEVEKLVLVMHEDCLTNSGADYILTSKNIQFVNLGVKTAAWNRVFKHRTILKHLQKNIEDCDFLLVRSPSPLAPYFSKHLTSTKVVFLIVGNYGEVAKHTSLKSLRNLTIKVFMKWLDWKFNLAINKHHVVVNSEELWKRYSDKARKISKIKTTTLSENDFYERNDTCQGKWINLLYTGRLDRTKGLFELLEAFYQLKNEFNNIRLNYVGWEDDSKRPIELALKKRSEELGVFSQVIFHGKKSLGKELNSMYRMADIFIIPSYHEGFPRVIWEAMANGLPVIATKVGGIPATLTDGKNALLVNKKEVLVLKDSIKKIIKDDKLRGRLISNGYRLARKNTLNVQTHLLIENIRS